MSVLLIMESQYQLYKLENNCIDNLSVKKEVIDLLVSLNEIDSILKEVELVLLSLYLIRSAGECDGC